MGDTDSDMNAQPEAAKKRVKTSGSGTKSITRNALSGKTVTKGKPAAKRPPGTRKTTAPGTTANTKGSRGKSASGAAATPAGKHRPRTLAGVRTAYPAQARSGTAGESAETPAASTQDPRSLSWMAEQAVSALNAVKASQTIKARALLEAARIPDQAADKPSLHAPSQAVTARQLHPTAPEQQAGHGPAEAASDKAVVVNPQGVSSIPPDNHAVAGQAAVEDDQGCRPQATRGNITAVPAAQEPALHQDPMSRFPGNDGNTPAAPAITGRSAAGERRMSWFRPGLMAAVLAVAGILGYQFLQENTHDGADTALSGEAPETTQPPLGAPAAPGTAITVTNSATGGDMESGSGDSLTWRPAITPGEPDTEAKPSREAAVDAGTPLPDTPVVDQRTPDTNGPDGMASETPAAPAVTHATDAARQTAQRTTPPAQGPGYGYYPQQPAWRQPYYRPGYSNYPGR